MSSGRLFEVEETAKRLGVKTTTVLTGNLAEFALGTPYGVDLVCIE